MPRRLPATVLRSSLRSFLLLFLPSSFFFSPPPCRCRTRHDLIMWSLPLSFGAARKRRRLYLLCEARGRRSLSGPLCTPFWKSPAGKKCRDFCSFSFSPRANRPRGLVFYFSMRSTVAVPFVSHFPLFDSSFPLSLRGHLMRRLEAPRLRFRILPPRDGLFMF